MPSQIEEVLDSSMSTQKSLSLLGRLKFPHPSLPDPGCLMRLLCPIVGVPISDMDCFRDYLTMGDWITSQLIRHDLPGLSAMTS